MSDELYEVALRNVPFLQAQALYRFLVNLNDEEPVHGSQGMTWSGLVPGDYRGQPEKRPEERTCTITPMPTHAQVALEQRRELKGYLAVLDVRMEALMAAIKEAPKAHGFDLEDVEFQYDRVLGAFRKLQETFGS